MPINNTTQNKEELEERWKLAELRCSEVIDLDQEPPVKYINIRAKTALKELIELKELVDKSISQAHQSGIEEGARAERVKIAKLLGDEYENMENNASFYLKLAESLKENKQ